MSKAVKSNPKLWSEVVDEVKNSTLAGKSGTWNARKAQHAVRIYKSRGGKYKSKKSDKNSLTIWTKEDWGYIDGQPGNRYLPKKVRESLTEQEKYIENRRKKEATKKGSIKAKYSDTVAAKVRKSKSSYLKK